MSRNPMRTGSWLMALQTCLGLRRRTPAQESRGCFRSGVRPYVEELESRVLLQAAAWSFLGPAPERDSSWLDLGTNQNQSTAGRVSALGYSRDINANQGVGHQARPAL